MSTRCSLRTRPRSRLTWWLRLRGVGSRPRPRRRRGWRRRTLRRVASATETSIVVARLIVLRFVLFPRHVTHILCSRSVARRDVNRRLSSSARAAATTSSSRRPSRRESRRTFRSTPAGVKKPPSSLDRRFSPRFIVSQRSRDSTRPVSSYFWMHASTLSSRAAVRARREPRSESRMSKTSPAACPGSRSTTGRGSCAGTPPRARRDARRVDARSNAAREDAPRGGRPRGSRATARIRVAPIAAGAESTLAAGSATLRTPRRIFCHRRGFARGSRRHARVARARRDRLHRSRPAILAPRVHADRRDPRSSRSRPQTRPDGPRQEFSGE